MPNSEQTEGVATSSALSDQPSPDRFAGLRKAVRIGYQVATVEVQALLDAYDLEVSRTTAELGSVPLTDDAIANIAAFHISGNTQDILDFARAVERAHWIIKKEQDDDR